MSINFRSDNESPAAEAILEALVAANTGSAWAYGEDDWTAALEEAFGALFECETTVVPLGTGTAANSIALAALCPPWGSVYCHREAHIHGDEGGAPEFYGQGLRIVPVEGPGGKLQPEALEAALRANTGHGVHSYAPAALSLTQSTECGTVYRPGELAALTALARERGMGTHLDGARFANAVAHLGCAPADLTWRAGIDLLSFGASKNGCLAAEALVIFDRPELRERVERLRKRGGHLFSKMRYPSAQLLAYLEGGRWLELAARANGQASAFARTVSTHGEARLAYPVEANEVFVIWNPAGFERLEAAGMEFHRWPGREDLARFVFSHATTDAETGALCAALDG
ncbi:MAG: beta-eliminating lyase-related protein [Deltaproteobacteria bacterium]|nr:beta-eliminating lyase-related protein [Deltaproteobacteria bacterium]